MEKLVVIVITVLACGVVSADMFGTGENQFSIDFVNISGDAGDLGSWSAGISYTFSGVNHADYRMGTYEITNDQWNKFQSSYGTVTGSPSNAYDESARWTGTNVPTNEVSWYEAAQFVNYLNTSSGNQAAYKFTGTQGTSNYTMSVWDIADAGYNESNPFRNINAKYFMPTEDEWVKAAYWNGTSLQTYATKNNTAPGEWSSTGGPNSDGQSAGWNYGYAYPENSSSNNQTWDVIAGYSPEELNGTFDMMGNVWEWMENPYFSGNYASGSYRGIRGGSYGHSGNNLSSSYPRYSNPSNETSVIGFRVASVPEPCSLVLLGLGGLVLARRRA